MKKYLLLISFSMFITKGVLAQVPVVDFPALALMAVNHQAQNENLEAIKTNETQIATMQTLITGKLETIKALEQKMYNSLVTVQSVLRDANSAKYAYEIVTDIGRYQGEMVEIARGDNELLLVALKTEAKLLDRTKDLILHVGIALTGGEIGGVPSNLMNNADRMNLIRHVIDELRVMRGLAYSITIHMRAAKYAGLWKTMNPFQAIWPSYESRKGTVDAILEERRKLKNW